MKPKITLDHWRFEYLKDAGTNWHQLRVGGFVRPDDGSDAQKNGTPFVEQVIDLQGHNKADQFTEGFELESETRTVVLGKKETF